MVKNLYKKLGVKGDGAFDVMTTHGLENSMVYLVIDAVHDTLLLLYAQVIATSKVQKLP